jgi:hypothetical protein
MTGDDTSRATKGIINPAISETVVYEVIVAVM